MTEVVQNASVFIQKKKKYIYIYIYIVFALNVNIFILDISVFFPNYHWSCPKN